MDELALKFLPFCDNECANRHDNAENCAEEARAFAEKIAIEYAQWTVVNSAFALHGFDGAFKIFKDEKGY